MKWPELFMRKKSAPRALAGLNRGATLLEAMISVVVLAMGSLGLIRLDLGSMQQAQRTRQNDQAWHQALSQQEEYRAQAAPPKVDVGGFTLVELLVSLVASSWVILAAVALFANGVQQREYQTASNLLQENERYVREVLTRSVHQVGFENQLEGGVLRPHSDPSEAKKEAYTSGGITDLVAFNNSGMDTEPPWGVFDAGAEGGALAAKQRQNTAKNRFLNNDVLMLRFQGVDAPSVAGSGAVSGGGADGSMINCVGQSESATLSASAWRTRPWVAYGVVAGANTGDEPELTCRYLNKTASNALNWVARPLARGVEVFQVMLAVPPEWGTGSKGALRWLAPDRVAEEGLWQSVVAVRFGLVLRSPNRVYQAGPTQLVWQPAKTPLTPLGTGYTNPESVDPGSHFTPPDDGRLRRVMAFTVSLRNPLSTEPEPS